MRSLRALALAAVLALVASAVAIAAPTSSKAPTISGKPNYDQKLTCNRGTWSPDAKSFDYSWLDGDYVVATGQTWRVTSTWVGYNITCRVAAHDVDGGTTVADSPAVGPIGTGLSTLKLKSVEAKNGTLTMTGVVGPKKTTRSQYGYGEMVLYRKGKDADTQLAGPVKVKKDGHFKIAGQDHGKHRYQLTYTPASGTSYGQKSVYRKIKVRS